VHNNLLFGVVVELRALLFFTYNRNDISLVFLSMYYYAPGLSLPQCRKLTDTNRTQQTHTYFNIG